MRTICGNIKCWAQIDVFMIKIRIYLVNLQQRQSQTSLNTPVVTLQTPMPPLASYSFGAQDFSQSGAMSADIMGLPQWHQGLVQHTRWVVQAPSPANSSSSSPSRQTLNGDQHHNLPCSLSHLAVSNSTPPPATSPGSIKVKSEPQSPPRDLSASGNGGSGGGGGGGGHQHNSNGSTGSGSSSSSNSSNVSTTGGVLTAINAITQLGGAGVGGGGGGSNGSADQATNLSVLSHSQQHLVMSNSRPSSTGHITPTPGMSTNSTITNFPLSAFSRNDVSLAN